MYLYSLFICAFAVRMVNLNQSLWLDETIVAKVVRTIPLLQIPFQFSPGDFHPPLYYMFISFWGSIFGHSEIALRMPSILSSLITGWFVFRIGSLLIDKKTGLWAATFFLFNPLIIYYSQEARMYMMATMFLTMALYYFLLLLKKTKSIYVILFNLFSFLAMFTFYGCGFFIVGMIMGSYFVKRKRLNYPFFLSIGLLFSLLLLSPLLLRQFVNAKMGLSEVKNWSLVLGKAEIKNFAMVFLKFSTGRLSWYPKWSYYLIAGVPTAITWVFIAFGMRRNKLLAFLLFFPLCVGYIISFVTPMMMYFRFLYLIPVMSVLLAMGVFSTSQKFARNDLKGMMIFLLLLFFSLIYLLNPQFHREDWKNLVQNIDPLQPVYMILPSSDPVVYYDPELSLFEIREIPKTVLPEYFQVIPYVEELYGYNHIQVLEQKGCIREMTSEYRGPLFLEKWKCAKILSSR